MVVSLPVNMFLDDTSANKSKKWKPLHCIQLQLSGLPVSERQNANTVKFIAASSVVSILDMMRAIIDDLQEVKRNGIQIYDARENEVVTVTTELALCVCDFCMMAEATNHMGATTNKFCPRCDADRSTCLYKGAERNPADTRRVLQRLAIINSKEIRQRYGLKPYANCLWDIINPHKDIPVGMLHWMFLGLGKHLLKLCISDLDQNQQEKLELLIESADQSSFVSKISRDMIKFIDSRQGKDIKSYIQIAPFHMKIAGLPNNRVNLLCKLAEICKMMVTKTEYFEDDLQCLNQMITDYLQTVKDEFPTILQKVKTHLSTHIVDDILHHGPPSAYQEDAFEKMHGRIRDQLFIQNQHAKSRDTSYSFAEMEILLHVTTGGYFMNLGEWVQATNNVLQTAKKNEVRDYLGLKRCEIKPKNILQKAKRSDNKKVVRNTISDDLDDLIGACNKLSNDLTINTQHCKTAIFKAVNCAVGEVANSGNPVLYLDVNDHNKECIGIFIEGFEIQSDHGDNIYMVKIQKMNRKDSSSQLGFSCDRVELSKAYIYVKATSVIQSVCLVHDCLSGFCYLKHRPQSVKIEQEFKEVNKLFWVHRENHHVYFVNRFRFSHEKLLQSKE